MPERWNSGAKETVVARVWLCRHIVSMTAVASCNNRRVVGNGVEMQPGARQTVPLQLNMWYHVIHINRGTVFSVGSVQRLYLENRNISQTGLSQESKESLQADRPLWVEFELGGRQSEIAQARGSSPRWSSGSQHSCKSLRSNAMSSCKIGASQQEPEPWNTVAEGTMAWEVVTRQLVNIL
jgi:hypothetical protein